MAEDNQHTETVAITCSSDSYDEKEKDARFC